MLHALAGTAVLVLIFVVLGVLGARYWRPRREELQAIYELSEGAMRAAEWGVKVLDSPGALEARVEAGQQALDQVVAAHVPGVHERAEEAVNGSFFLAALKGVVPRETWKADYEALSAQTSAYVLQPEQLSAALNHTLQQAVFDMNIAASEGLGQLSFSTDASHGLSSLVRDRERMGQFLGGSEPLVDYSLGRAQQRGLTLGVAGGAAAAALLLPSAVHSASVLGAIFTATTAPGGATVGLGMLVGEWLHDHILKQFGDHIFDELGGALAAAGTGIGVIFTAYKGIKYGLILKRLLVDKEPLVDMRRQFVEHAETVASEAGERAKQSVGPTLQAASAELRTGLIRLQESAAQQMAWAVEHMRHAA